MFKIIKNNFFPLTLVIFSLCFSSTPKTLKNQKNKPSSEFYRDFKEVENCKIEYMYDFKVKEKVVQKQILLLYSRYLSSLQVTTKDITIMQTSTAIVLLGL